MSPPHRAHRGRRILRAALLFVALSITSCGLDPLDYAEFEVSCARDRCPTDFCCNDEAICVEGDVDDYGLCPGVRR